MVNNFRRLTGALAQLGVCKIRVLIYCWKASNPMDRKDNMSVACSGVATWPVNTFSSPLFSCFMLTSSLELIRAHIFWMFSSQCWAYGVSSVITLGFMRSLNFSGNNSCIRFLNALIRQLKNRDVFCKYPWDGCVTAAFKSLLIHISCASSNATEYHLLPVILTVKPPVSKDSIMLAGNCLRSARCFGIIFSYVSRSKAANSGPIRFKLDKRNFQLLPRIAKYNVK